MFKNLLQLQRYFNNERVCIEFIEQQRWHGKPECPHCGSEHHYRTATRLKSDELKGYKDFWCKACNKKFTTLTGSIYESSKISLQVWLSAVYLVTAHKKGISSVQLAKDLGITQKTAWFINHRIREMLKERNPEALNNTVEVDETFIGGKAGNKSLKKRAALKEAGIKGYMGKAPVVGMIERKGKLIAQVVSAVDQFTLQPLVIANVNKDAMLISDNFGGYTGLNKKFASHEIINHSLNEYVRGNVHTNTIEGFWSLFKRGVLGIYHFTSPQHLQRYVDEFSYRYNSRKLPDVERFKMAVERCGNGRIKYQSLIGK